MKPEKTWDDAMESVYKIMLEEWSKEEIIEYIRCRDGYTKNDMTAIIPKVTVTDAPNEWIPCKERLPESYGKYIVTSGDPVFEMHVHMLNYGEAMFEKDNPCWFFYDSEYGDVTVDDVIAWMPLPMPYKESEHNEVYETIKRGLEDAVNGRATEYAPIVRCKDCKWQRDCEESVGNEYFCADGEKRKTI